MSKSKVIRILAPAVLFAVGFAATLFIIKQNPPAQKAKASINDMGRKDVPGLSTGERITLPTIVRLGGGSEKLGAAGDPYFVCAFFSVECPGCSMDFEFWGDLSEEAAKRKVGFYLISLDTDQDKVGNFTRAYGLQELPVYFDPTDQTIRSFKVGIVPQYLLVRADGIIAGRWDGVRRYEGKQLDFGKVLQLFEPMRESSPSE